MPSLMRRLVLLILLFLAAPVSAWAADRPLTILIGVDGFRADYLTADETPSLWAIAGRGVKGRGMRPSFPSLTFPNHYTLVTGLRPDHHGLVDNVMEDPERPGQTFTMSAKAISGDPFWWNGAEPLWVTAERAGVRTATMFWPGSDLPVRGARPSAWRVFDKNVLAPARVDQVLAWLDAPERDRLRFITLYFDDVDTAGHFFGPGSAERRAATRRVDMQIGRLTDELARRGMAANLVVVADHGMAEVSRTRLVFLDDLVPADAIRVLTFGGGAELYPAPGRTAEVERALLGAHANVTCWRKAEMPARLGFGTHRRIPPIVCLARTGWMLTTREREARWPMTNRGAHGFDPADPAMRALFVAAGPAFRPGTRVPVFDNVDVYPLLARLIGVEALPGDGDLRRFRGVLRD